ncbi:putative acyl-CoA synthase, partial [Vibrio parahaemolyticus V-223/04]
MSLVMV